MGGFGEIWTTGVVTPMADALAFLTTLLGGNYGLAIILFTITVKLILLPLTMQQIRSSRAMMQIQPELQALQKKYGKDREKLMQEQMRLYKENKVNPAAGCLPLLIQMPIWIGLYQGLYHLAQTGFEPAQQGFLWIPNLAHPEGMPWVFAILTGITQWVTQRMMTPRSTDPQQQTMNQMMQFMPIMFVFFAFSVPAGLVLYWVTSNLFTFVQQYFATGWGSLALPKSVSQSLARSLPSPLSSLFEVEDASQPQAKLPQAKLSKDKAGALAIEPPSRNGRNDSADANANGEESPCTLARDRASR